MANEQYHQVPRNPTGMNTITMRRGHDAFRHAGSDLIGINLINTTIQKSGWGGSQNVTIESPIRFILSEPAGGAATITLPNAALYQGHTVWVKKLRSVYMVNVVPEANSGATIDGRGFFRLQTMNSCVGMLAHGGNWHVTSYYAMNYPQHDAYDSHTTSGTTLYTDHPNMTKKVTASGANPATFFIANGMLSYGVPMTFVRGTGQNVTLQCVSFNENLDNTGVTYTLTSQYQGVTMIACNDSGFTTWYIVDEK